MAPSDSLGENTVRTQPCGRRPGRSLAAVVLVGLVSVVTAACAAGGVVSPVPGTAAPVPTASAVTGGGSSVSGDPSAAAPKLPELFAGLPYAMDLPGWLGGGPARWDSQIRTLTATGVAPDKLAELKRFDAPIVGNRFFGIDAGTDLALYVDSALLPPGVSNENFLAAAARAMVAAALKDGAIVTQPVTDRVTSPLGGEAVRNRYVTRSVNLAGSEFDEARVAYLFQVKGVGYTLLFTSPVSDNRYDEIARLVSTFRQKAPGS